MNFLLERRTLPPSCVNRRRLNVDGDMMACCDIWHAAPPVDEPPPPRVVGELLGTDQTQKCPLECVRARSLLIASED
jgi:hypothetical protein